MDTIFKCRSEGKYTDTVITDEQIKQVIKAACKLPEGIEPLGLVSIGEQIKEYAEIDRYMEDRVSYNTYGTKWDK